MTSLVSKPSKHKYVPIDNACFLIVRYADSLGKSTSDLCTIDMYRFAAWVRKHAKNKKAKESM